MGLWRNGSRAGLRNQSLRGWEFESPQAYQLMGYAQSVYNCGPSLERGAWG